MVADSNEWVYGWFADKFRCASCGDVFGYHTSLCALDEEED